jgi:hypothetical protein
MNEAEYIDLINEVESRFAVEEWTIDGLHIWPIIRIPSRFRLYIPDSRRALVEANSRRLHRIYERTLRPAVSLVKAAHAEWFDRGHHARLCGPVDAVFLTHSTCRLFAVHGGMYDVFCDPLVAVLEENRRNSLVLEFASNGEYRLPRYGHSLFLDKPRVALEIARLLGRRRRGLAFDRRSEYEDLGRFLANRAADLSLPSPTELLRYVRKLRLWADYFEKVVTRVSPSVGFVVDYYGMLGMAFCLACRECGIVSVDIQHGVQNDLHPAYGRWRRLPSAGYELMPAVFWCWSEEEAETNRKWSGRVTEWHRPVVGGNPYLEMFRDSNNSLVRSFDQQVAAVGGRHNADLHILMTLRPGTGLSDLLRQAIAVSPESWFWWVRLHPGMMTDWKKIRSMTRSLRPSGVELDAATDLPLHSLLRRVNVHVTECSSTVIEAEHFGVPSVVAHETGALYYRRQIDSGVAVTAFTPTELIEAIRAQAARQGDFGRHRTGESGQASAAAGALETIFLIAKEKGRRRVTTV